MTHFETLFMIYGKYGKEWVDSFRVVVYTLPRHTFMFKQHAKGNFT